jgi:hypothetical protein
MINLDIDQITSAAARIINAPWVRVSWGACGFDTIFIRVSLQSPEEWAWKIMENSTNAGFKITRDGTVENWLRFSRGFPKMRLSRGNAMEQALQRINIHVQQARAALPVS